MAVTRVFDISDDVQSEIFQEGYLDGMPCHERIGDVIYIKMSSASEDHQDLIFGFMLQLKSYLENIKSNCTVKGKDSGWELTSYVSELRKKDRLEFFIKKREFEWREKSWENRKDKEFPLILVPDVMLLCDRFEGDWGSNGYKGIPSFIIEVLSPSTANNDYTWKKDIYEAMGVAEYWIIDIIDTFKAIRHVLIDGRYVSEEFFFKDVLKFPSQVFSGLVLDISVINLSFFKYLDKLR